jgi:hypothetical protein
MRDAETNRDPDGRLIRLRFGSGDLGRDSLELRVSLQKGEDRGAMMRAELEVER